MLKKAQAEVSRFDKKLGTVVTTTVGLALPIARALLAGGATRRFRKSERGGVKDTVVVKLYVESYVGDAVAKAQQMAAAAG